MNPRLRAWGWSCRGLGVCVIAALLLPVPALAQAPLRICMDEDLPPYSVAHGDTGSGFDVALATALAAHMGRPLAIQWYETKLDSDSSPTLELNALLSDGRCDAVAGYPLVADSLGRPGIKSARLPDFKGATAADRRRRVDLGTIVPSQPYQRAPLALLLAPGIAARRVSGLADVSDLHFGVEGGTFADVILMLYHHGSLVDHITHYPVGRATALAKLESGEIDATFLSLGRFDAYRQEHPETKIRASGFNYPLAFNLGYATLSTNAALLDDINSALAAMRASGEIRALAQSTGVTYVEPQDPAVSPAITFAQLSE